MINFFTCAALAGFTVVVTDTAIGQSSAAAAPTPPIPARVGDQADGQTPLTQRDDWQNWRVGGELGGDMFTTVKKVSESLYTATTAGSSIPRTYKIDTALPTGYPLPTPPGAMELKRYPSVRRAEQGGKGEMSSGMNGAFWPLFAHIQRNKIAMTAPVDMDLHWMRDRVNGAEAPATGGEQATASQERWTMSFLYRTADLRETGTEGTVRIVDVEPMTVISIGLDGRGLGMSRAGMVQGREAAVDAAIEKLNAWLDAQAEWVPYGSPRLCGYNDPSVRPANQWWEVQIPIKPALPARAETPTTPAESAATSR